MKQTENKNRLKCFHCGDFCANDNIKVDDNVFCCEGCKTVFQLLNENGMCAYYELEKNPGFTIKAPQLEKFAWLDDASITSGLYDFRDENLARITLYIPRIHCSSCILLLENLYKIQTGILSSRVNFVKQEIALSFNPTDISLRKIVEVLDSLGYTPEINLETTIRKAPPKKDYSLLYKIGVAGFCSGNIMLLSFPEYFGMDELNDSSFKTLFGFLNLILALPVVFYSASDYFTGAISGLKNKVINLEVPIVLGIVAIFVRSVYEVISQTGPGYFDSLTGLLFFLLIGKWYQRKTYQHFSFERDYHSYFPVAVIKIEEDREKPVAVKDLQPGDTILIRNNEVIPVDAWLREGDAFVDYSFVSGEAMPVRKMRGAILYAGGKQTGRAIRLEVKEKFAQNYFLQLWNKDVFQKTKNAYLSGFVLSFSKYFTIGTLVIAASTFLFWHFTEPSRALFALTSVLLVACPCALALSLPFALTNSLRRLGKEGMYMKDADTVEILAETDTIVFDKTGTITESDLSELQYYGEELYRNELIYLRSAVQQSSHPLSRSLYSHLKAETLTPDYFKETPAEGIHCRIGDNEILVGSARFVQAPLASYQNGTQVYVKINQRIKGYFEIRNKYRDGIEDLLKDLSADYSIHLLSGDNNSEFQHLKKYIDAEKIQFKQSPTGKLEYIEQLKHMGKRVLMVGDGLNDSGALKAADVGLAVSDNVYNFFPASDGMIDGSKLKNLAAYMRFARHSRRVIQASLVLSLLYNAVGLFFAVQGLLSPLIAAILMPLSSVSAVLFVVAGTSWRIKK